MSSIPILNLHGQSTEYEIGVRPGGAGESIWTFPEGYVGRDLDEGILIETLRRLVSGVVPRCDDVIGLCLEQQDGCLLVTVSQGSGTVRMLLDKAAIAQSLG